MLNRTAQVARTGFLIFWWLVTAAWLGNFFEFGKAPFWIIILGHFALLLTLPKPEKPESTARSEPSFLRWLVDGTMVVGSLAGGALFVIASGLMEGEPFQMNLGVKIAIAILIIALTCPLISRYLEQKGL
ncbi:hypothetical protein [uncultured Brevundimonas sp.]|uniref:hypothetical protein n=1 Tax=uncultured Brevundimonas sp. TaxID=213418 RepID=UPI002618A0D2|nr:hypothetical protein [uncultured Brevundimonas sp.]